MSSSGLWTVCEDLMTDVGENVQGYKVVIKMPSLGLISRVAPDM